MSSAGVTVTASQVQVLACSKCGEFGRTHPNASTEAVKKILAEHLRTKHGATS